MPAIEARDLTKIYRTYRKESGLRGAIKGLVRRRYDETRAADAVSFQIEEGEFVGFLGPNGAGKTTVLNMLSGLLNPTIGLDVVSQKRVREFLRIYNKEHRIVTLLTSHYMQDIQELTRRVLVIDHGKIFFDGPLDEIVDRFSIYKILSLTFDKQEARDFSRFGEVIEQTPMSIQLKLPSAQVTETTREVLKSCDVSEINVDEVPVEEVIRQLFGERRSQQSAAETQSNAAAVR